MISVRTALNLLLVLALVASGLGAVSAEHGLPAAEASAAATPPCHGEPVAEPTQSRDCCSDNACACDCLHISPLLVELPRAPTSVPSGVDPQSLRDFASPSMVPRPLLRPPIA